MVSHSYLFVSIFNPSFHWSALNLLAFSNCYYWSFLSCFLKSKHIYFSVVQSGANLGISYLDQAHEHVSEVSWGLWVDVLLQVTAVFWGEHTHVEELVMKEPRLPVFAEVSAAPIGWHFLVFCHLLLTWGPWTVHPTKLIPTITQAQVYFLIKILSLFQNWKPALRIISHSVTLEIQGCLLFP